MFAASVARPVRQLKGFKKIRLAVGEKKQVDFVIGKKQLRFLDAQWRPTVEAVRFVVYIGNSSDATMSLNFSHQHLHRLLITSAGFGN